MSPNATSRPSRVTGDAQWSSLIALPSPGGDSAALAARSTLARAPSAASKARRSKATTPVLITGGAGFVGAELAEYLLQSGPVVVVDDLSVGRPMPPHRPGLTCHQADIRDRAAMLALMARHRPRAVIHLAAIHHIPTCERDPHHAMDVNVMGFQSVLDACSAAHCRRVLLASSGAIYGWSDGALAETALLSPADQYSASKAANEHQLTAWANAGNGDAIIARMFNVIGPNDPNGHLIPDILRRLDSAAADVPLTLKMGNLDRRRDFVDVLDMAEGLSSLADRGWVDGVAPAIYNLCSGRDHSVSDIALLLAHHSGIQAHLVSDPTLCRSIDRPSQLGDPAKVWQQIGWRAQRSLEDSIAAIIAAWRHP